MKLPVTVLVITPPDREHSVDNTLASIALQVYPDYKRCIDIPLREAIDLEVLVVDDGDTSGRTAEVCAKYPFVRRIYRANRNPIDGFGKPAIPYNIGLLASRELIVMQSGDVMWTRPTDLERLLRLHFERNDPQLVTLATCYKIGEPDGMHTVVSPKDSRELLFTFGSAFRRSFAVSLGGFEEGYEAWGQDEEDLARLMLHHGADVVWLPPDAVMTYHQYHPWVASSRMNVRADVDYLEQRRKDIKAGHLANEGRSWGNDI